MIHGSTHVAVRQRGRAGQSLTEFAVSVPLFFLLVFGIVDIGRVLSAHLTLQHATRQAGRFAVTGRTLSGLSREDSIRLVAKQAAAGLDVQALEITSCCSSTGGSAGGPEDTVTISISVNLHLFTPLISRFFGEDGAHDFTVRTTFKNEPFIL